MIPVAFKQRNAHRPAGAPLLIANHNILAAKTNVWRKVTSPPRTGSGTTSGNTTTFYGADGRRTGSATVTGKR
jgi:hypothetical protein